MQCPNSLFPPKTKCAKPNQPNQPEKDPVLILTKPWLTGEAQPVGSQALTSTSMTQGVREERYEQGLCQSCSSLKSWDAFWWWFHTGCLAAWKHQDLGLWSSTPGTEWGVWLLPPGTSPVPHSSFLPISYLFPALLSISCRLSHCSHPSLPPCYSSIFCFGSDSSYSPHYTFMTVIYDPEFKDLLQCTHGTADSKWCVQPGYYSLKSQFLHNETSGLCIPLSSLLYSNFRGLFSWE